MVDIKINPTLDIAALNTTYHEHGRLQIPNFFTDESAEYLLSLILQNTVWNLAYNDNNGFYESKLSDFEQLSTAQKQGFMQGVYRRATEKFQYCFIQYYISQAIELGEDKGHPLHKFHEFLNSEDYLEFARALTGEPDIRKADSYVSRYEKGHFLTNHDDTHAKHDRVAACTFGMTKNWKLEWGGHLVFTTEAGDIIQGLIPSFNTFNIFKIPQNHSVQMVTDLAPHPRYNLLSWLQR